jgi:hypothetical protein
MGIEDREQREQDEQDLIEDLELDEKSAADVVGGDGGPAGNYVIRKIPGKWSDINLKQGGTT